MPVKRKTRVRTPNRTRRHKGLVLRASGEKSSSEGKRGYRAWLDLDGLYRPLKKPVTLRLDADVLAWFKKDGKRYQTRINQALRTVMEQEMKETGE